MEGIARDACAEANGAELDRTTAGHQLNLCIRLDAQGQIEGAILIGIGTALMEEFIPGASTGFGDYYLPTIKSMPEIEVMLIEVPSFHGPLGAKGLGEPTLLPAAPAIVNAVSRAVGARVWELPATPERVLRAIQSRQKECITK